MGQTGGMEERIVAANGLKFAGIAAGKFRRDHFAGSLSKLSNPATLGLNTRDALRTIQGLTGALKLLRQFKPDVVFLKGGYVCLPVGLAARMLRIPYIIHESDLDPGLTNRILSRWAQTIAVGFPESNYKQFQAERLAFTGNPVRPAIVTAHRLEGLGLFNLTSKLPVLTITGGSQGAAEINDVVLAALPDLLEICQVIHITGEAEYKRLDFNRQRQTPIAHADRYHAYPYLQDEMPAALATADIIVTRAGASAIAEAAILHKPTVLIPNTNMAGHQVTNARTLARAGAARVLQGDQFTPLKLVREVRGLLHNKQQMEQLGEAIGAFGRPDAAMALAQVILDTYDANNQNNRAGEPHD